MRESHGKGLASHPDPESCVDGRGPYRDHWVDSCGAFQSIGPAKDRTKCTGILPSNGRFNPFLPFYILLDSMHRAQILQASG